MHHIIHPAADHPVLLAEAHAAAARLRRQLRLPTHQEPDLRQELLADLIRRLPAYDPARGTLGAFAGVILRNHSARIAARVLRERERSGGPLVSIDAVDGTDRALVQRLSEEDGLAGGTGVAGAAAMEQRLDLVAALRSLDRRDRAFCLAVARTSVEMLVAHGFGSRAGLYRRLRDLRCRLTAGGFRAA